MLESQKNDDICQFNGQLRQTTPFEPFYVAFAAPRMAQNCILTELSLFKNQLQFCPMKRFVPIEVHTVNMAVFFY